MLLEFWMVIEKKNLCVKFHDTDRAKDAESTMTSGRLKRSVVLRKCTWESLK
jgi:hypothetical protein